MYAQGDIEPNGGVDTTTLSIFGAISGKRPENEVLEAKVIGQR